MNHLIFTAGSEFFGPLPKGLGQDYYHDLGQLNLSHTGSWTPLVSPNSTLSIAVYTSMYYVLTYFAGSFRRYNVHAKVFWWLMTVYPIVTVLTGFQFANLLPYLAQVVPTMSGYCIDSSKASLPGAASSSLCAPLNSRDTASEAQFCTASNHTTSPPSCRSFGKTNPAVIQNFKLTNLLKFNKKANVHMLL
ncbi:hypothetical protein DSO57_1033832 [Entomophthora muscae]|uniref:Uncharacterized protein n=1 Tax=Entomophthora muscae TaxID=34485 RepID=A0ACC2REN8_9FUNG|nr:hypothetical protein DSO57_1033832 [Entomophthora muscae]